MTAIRLDVEDAIATVTLNRPEKLNALSEEMKSRLVQVFEELGADPDVRAVVVTGEGRAFCAGGDVGTMAEQTPVSAQMRIRRAQRTVRAIADLNKPVVAAVRGPVAGIGWSMALACDLVVASQTATFHQSFKQIGLVPDGGAIFFLIQSMGPARAKELVYLARPLKAEEGLAYGVVNRVVPDGDLGEEARHMATDLACGPTFAFGLAKQIFRSLPQPHLDAFLESEAWAQGLAMLSQDHREGAAAFREKRKPQFRGK